MKMKIALVSSLAVAALALAACGNTGNATSGSSGAGGASSSGAGGGTSSVSTGGQGSTSVTSTAASSSASSSSSATSSSTGGGMSALVPSLVSMDMYINCMPSVPPDPIIGSFTASYDNTQGKAAGSATIKSEVLTFHTVNSMDTFTFTATPNGIANVDAGMKSNVAHVKDANSLKGTGMPCSYCGGGSTWSLKVTWDVAGKTVDAETQPVPVDCVF